MKKILIMMAAAVALISCGDKNPLLFDETKVRVYNDVNAEFDTMSYVVGMNLGLGMSLQNNSIDFDRNIVTNTILDEFSKETVDYDFLEENTRTMQRFQGEHLRPYNMAKRSRQFGSDTPDTLTLYNDEFTPESISRIYGYEYAYFMRRFDLPVNIHWVIKGINDSENVTKVDDIDSIMMVDAATARKYMNEYTSTSFLEHNTECTRRWLENVAQHEDVQMMVVEGDTLYYRIENPGNDLKPSGIHDTVSFDYDVYARNGRPVESLAQRIKSLKESLDRTRNNTQIDSATRALLVNQIEEQLYTSENLRIPLKQATIKGARYAMQQIGVGGSMTMWLPSSLAYGSRGNRAVAPNDGIIMHVTLTDVVNVDPSETGEIITPGKAKITTLPTPSKTTPIVPSPGTVTPQPTEE